METKPKTKIKKFWTTNPDLLQRNISPLQQSILQSSITTTTQSDQPRFKQPTSNTTTQCTQPNNKNHTSTCTKPQLLPQYTTAFFLPTRHPSNIEVHIHKHHHLTLIYPSTDRQHPHSMLQPICNTIYYPNKLIKPPTNTTHITTSTLASKSSHVHQQYRPTITHHENNNNQSTKTTKTNTTQRPQHNSHKIHHERNQTNTLKPQHTTTSTPNMATVSHFILQLFHKQINPTILNLLIQHGNQSVRKRHR